MDTPYLPIPCSFHDRLLHYATLGDRVEIVLLIDGAAVHFSTRIKDVFTRDHAEFIVLEGGGEYRLDRIQSVNGIAVHDGACEI